MIVKCKKCANQLVEMDDQHILSAHDKATANLEEEPHQGTCQTLVENAEVFVHEDHLPEWINTEVEQSQWTKGKLKCSKCGLKVGSFDFVSGTRCKCELNSVLPSVHFIRSKVDLRK